MNSQNILKFWGSKLDLKLDSSEYYDYEVAKTETDYNVEVLDFDTPIVYDSLKINTTGLMGTSCNRSTIYLTEVDNRSNDPSYPYSAYTWCLFYTNFTSQLGNSDTLLENDIYEFVDVSGYTHYFRINTYNQPLSNLSSLNVTGFTGNIVKCELLLSDESLCCDTDPIKNAKPWAYQINHGSGTDNCEFLIDRRPEKGWTIDIVFNRENLPWTFGNTFYYIGTRGTTDIEQYADNNLSFSFTSDRRIVWKAIHYSGYCGDSGYTESYYTLSGQTPQLCVSGTSEDFEITITFDRYRHLTDCNVENDGGWNDLIPGVKPIPYTPESGSSVTSTQTTVYSTDEELSKKWAFEKHRRLGVLKIYLNGRPVYKYENFEEVIPSERGVQPFIQSWGRGTTGSGGIHYDGVSCFNFKRVKYFDEPLDFVHVRHHYLSTIKPNYDIIECVQDCPDEVTAIVVAPTPTPTVTPGLTLTPTPTVTSTPTVTPTITSTPTTSTPTVNGISISGSVSPGSIVVTYDAQMDFPLDGDISLYALVTLQTISGDPITSVMDFIIPSGQTQARHIDIIDDDYQRLSVDQYNYTSITANHTGSTPYSISPSLQVAYVPMSCYFDYSVTEFFASCDFEFSATEFFEYPLNDLLYSIIPSQDFSYVLIPNSDLTYTLIPNGDFLYQFIPNNDVTHITLPDNDLLYSVIPNNDGTYTLIPNNDVEYEVLSSSNRFHGQIKLGEDSVEGTCNCSVGECPRFFVTGDGPTFCESNIFVTNGDGFNLNGWGTIVYNGFYKTVNLNGSNIATYRTDCGTCPTTPTPTPTETPTPTPTETPAPTPTPTITYYYYYLLNCNLGDNKYGRSTNPSLSGTYNVDTNTCYSIVGIDNGPSYDYDLDISTIVTDCNDILCSVATPTPTPTSTETPTPTPTLTSSSTPTPTPTSTESPLDFTISSDCINGGAVYTNNHIGGSGVYDRGTGLYDSESEALNETGWIQISNPINTVSSSVPYFNTTRTYWIALRDRNNQSNVVAKSILVDCTPTLTPTYTSAPTPTPTATSTPTPTSTLPPLNFTISGICQNDGSISISNLVGSVSNNYQYTGGIHTTENSALNATFWGSIVGGNIGVVTIGSSGTYWVAVRETENPSNIIAKSVTINCVETSGLVLHYDPSVTFSYPGTGTTINDLTGQGRTGTMSNITFTSPYLTFNGTSSQISVPDSIGLEPQTGDFTFEAWIYHSVITGSQRTFISKTDNGGGASDWSYGLRTNAAGATYLEIGNGTTSVTSPSYTVSTGQWYQIVGVWSNVASNSITLYVNGISQGSNSHSFTSVKNSTNPLYLGNYNGNEYQQSLNGRMGIVRMYNKSLTASEVLGNYNTDKSKYGL